MSENQNPQNDNSRTMPNLNFDQTVEDVATTVGAYTGAAVTAGITGLFALGAGLFRGLVGGAQATFQNGQTTQPNNQPTNQG